MKNINNMAVELKYQFPMGKVKPTQKATEAAAAKKVSIPYGKGKNSAPRLGASK